MQVVQAMYIRVEEKEEYNTETDSWEKKILYSGHETDMTDYPGWIMLDDQRHKVVFQIPEDFSFNKTRLEALKKEMESLRASFQARLTELQAQYNQHLAIEG